jgi:hypothetical protein
MYTHVELCEDVQAGAARTFKESLQQLLKVLQHSLSVIWMGHHRSRADATESHFLSVKDSRAE